ncbi:MAG: alkaline phosphatase [Caulobacterales bacterium 68-7]|nr:MAG: alkaline phosphatase [Caulobacterales bacterium 68-7]
MTLNRRRALTFGLVAAAPAVHAQTPAAVAFKHGVAAGDPLADRLILWTRITTEPTATPAVTWQIAEEQAFARIVAKGTVIAQAASDHTVKIDVGGLKPGREYWYRFSAQGVTSPVGRARTLPVGATPDVVLAVVSCSLYPGGLFNAYEALAQQPRVDAVLHLGDYIYEYGAEPGQYGMEIGSKIGRVPDPPHEIVSLADYRRRHALYKADADLQAAHARAAWICVWDDHETANDSWIGGAENHQPEKEGVWATRKAAALKAYFEWMPIRDPKGRMAEAIQRSFDFGDLATLIMVETRLQARSEQLSFAKDLPITAGPDGRPNIDVKGFIARLNAPERALLGQEQEAWIGGELKRSRQSGRKWQVIGNQVVMARVFGPDLEKVAGPAWPEILAGLDEATRNEVAQAAQLFKLGLPMNLDSWDGYPAARERLYDLFKAADANPIVLAGDSHAFWVNDLLDASGRRVAWELGSTGITSPSWGDSAPKLPLGAAVTARNDEVIFNDQLSKGFALLTLTPDGAKAELFAVSTILAKPYETRRVATARSSSQAGALKRPTMD